MVDTRLLKESLPGDVRELCSRLRDAGFRAWVVGGCVRDHLLAHVRAGEQGAALRNDWDVATDAHPEQVQKLFRRVIPTGIKHGTVTVLIQGVGYEVTTLRGEAGYSDGRRPDAVFFVDDIVADLARRDFTINAMAYDPLQDLLIDPFGGRQDLRAGMLRAVGDATERFAEDGLRVLRAARFAATLEMTIEATTAQAIGPSLDSYRRVSPERVREEWVKSMKAERPSRAFVVMQEHGLLTITAPELAALAEAPEHPTPFAAALDAVDRCPPSVVLRMAALLASLNPPAATTLVERLRFSNRERDRITALVRHQDIRYQPPWSDVEMRRFIQQTGTELTDDLLELVTARAAPERQAELSAFADHMRRTLAERPPLAIKDLAVKGSDLISQAGLSPGPAVGQTLRTLLDEVIDNPRLNERDALLARARQLAES